MGSYFSSVPFLTNNEPHSTCLIVLTFPLTTNLAQWLSKGDLESYFSYYSFPYLLWDISFNVGTYSQDTDASIEKMEKLLGPFSEDCGPIK